MFEVYFQGYGSALAAYDGRIIGFYGKSIDLGHCAESTALIRENDQLFFASFDGKWKAIQDARSTAWSLPYFMDGLVSLENVEGKHGYMDHFGNWVIPPLYLCANGFHNDGLALVRVENGTMAIDQNGGVIAKLENIFVPYELEHPNSIECFNGKRAGKEGEQMPCLVLNLSEIVDFEDCLRIGDPYRGVVACCFEGEKWELRTKENVSLTTSVFSHISYFSCGLAIAKTSSERCGAIDTEGRWRIPPEYSQLESFRQGLTVGQRVPDGPSFVIDSRGEVRFVVEDGDVSIRYDHIQVNRGDRTDILDSAGNLLFTVVWNEPRGVLKQ